MPIRAENRLRYPRDWARISLAIRRDRAGWACEAAGCGARQAEPHPITGSRVVLTVAHLNHRPEDCRPENLMALCQRCHNRLDAAVRAAGLRARRRNALNVADLFGQPGDAEPPRGIE